MLSPDLEDRPTIGELLRRAVREFGDVEYMVADDIPTLPSGKPDRRALLTQVADDPPTSPSG